MRSRVTAVCLSLWLLVSPIFLYPASPAAGSASSTVLAPTPPMGWNSYDAYGGIVNESEVRANAKYLADHLARFGWKYVTVDFYWYFANPVGDDPYGQDKLKTSMDEYGRLLPDPVRFPSSIHGNGFKPLADYVHGLGLKFGIHIMRGIPRQAVGRNLPVLGTSAHAKDIANLQNTCSWSSAMYGVDVSNAAGQAYYDSIAQLYAQWGADFIKADDMSWGENPAKEGYHAAEIKALRQAMNKTGRPMILSLSPGPAPLEQAAHLTEWSQMWRMSGDMWDNWKDLLAHFALCRAWVQYAGPNHWPDADMLPLGRVRVRGFSDKEVPHKSYLSHDEEVTLMTLWVISRSPLIMGGELPTLDPETEGLLTNDETLAVDQAGARNHEVYDRGPAVVWEADAADGQAKYVALFDTGDQPGAVTATWEELGLRGKYSVRDLWQKKDLGTAEGKFVATLPAHAAGLYRLTPAR